MADKVSATRNLHPFLGIFVDEKHTDKKMKDSERYIQYMLSHSYHTEHRDLKKPRLL